MASHSLRIGLFDPGMTHIHRVGLAGLYMTLGKLDPADFTDVGTWRLEDHGIELVWARNPRSLLERIIKESFTITDEGLIDFLAYKDHPMGDLQRVLLHNAIMSTYLQHGQSRKTEKADRHISIRFEDKTLNQRIKALREYSHQKIGALFIRNGDFRNTFSTKGWLFPGATVRHVGFQSETAISAGPGESLCLWYAPIASLYYLIQNKRPDGEYDGRKGAAIVFPHIRDLGVYSGCYRRYLGSPSERLYANSLGDAGMLALLSLSAFRPDGMLSQLEVDSCSVVTMGKVSWASQQKTRTSVMHLMGIDTSRLNAFSLSLRSLDSTWGIAKDGGLRVRTSLARGVFAENLARGRDWFEGFHRLMQSGKLARALLYERRGLAEMIDKVKWSAESDKLFVESIHTAIRNRFGALASRARQKGEAARFDREFERMRSSLARAKNGQSLRAEIADLFARGGINRKLQEHWSAILPLFSGPDWQKARDLALLALASYSGAGANEAIIEPIGEEEEE